MQAHAVYLVREIPRGLELAWAGWGSPRNLLVDEDASFAGPKRRPYTEVSERPASRREARSPGA